MKRLALQVVLAAGLLPGVAFVVLPWLADDDLPPSPYETMELLRVPGPRDTRGSLRNAFVAFLAGDSRNLAAAETAEYLRSREVRIEMRLFDSPHVLAEFDSQERLISLNPERAASRYLSKPRADAAVSLAELKSMEDTWDADPRILQEFVRRSSWLVVHEAHHGTYAEALGTSWNSAEQETACRTYEILFLLARLREDGNFLDLDDYDHFMRFFLAGGFEGPLPEATLRPAWADSGWWWRQPLPKGATLSEVERAARRLRETHPGRFEDLVYHWYLIHQAHQDLDLFWETLDTLMPRSYDRAGQDPGRHMAALRAQAESLEASLRGAAGAKAEETLRELAYVRQHLEADAAFYAEPDRVAAYRDYFRKERVRLRGLLADARLDPQ